jgi:hypothetical protein
LKRWEADEQLCGRIVLLTNKRRAGLSKLIGRRLLFAETLERLERLERFEL